METGHKDTEKIILEAARIVFIQNGYEGTSMQHIADEAGINKALLHYYFRNKDRLFEGVFMEAFTKMIPNLFVILQTEIDFFEKIELFIDSYISALQQFPQIPLFILHELKRNPDRVVELISNTGINPALFIALIEKEIKNGTIRELDPIHFLVNMLAMCIFPFAAKPMIQGFILKNDAREYDRFINARKKEVTSFIINAIKK